MLELVKKNFKSETRELAFNKILCDSYTKFE